MLRVEYSSGPFYLHVLTLIVLWISNHIHYKKWGEISYPFPNFNGCTNEVWEWISNFISHFTGHVISYPCWDLSQSMLVKRVPYKLGQYRVCWCPGNLEMMILPLYNVDIFSCDQAALWMVFSVRLSVCPSVRPSVCPSVRLSVRLSHLFDYVPIIVSSWNFQELSHWTRVRSMQKVKVRGQRSRSQRSRPNFSFPDCNSSLNSHMMMKWYI